jgi:hypothetical protein
MLPGASFAEDIKLSIIAIIRDHDNRSAAMRRYLYRPVSGPSIVLLDSASGMIEWKTFRMK